MTTTEVITYAELARRVGDAVLMNQIVDVDPDMLYEGLENGSLWMDEEDTDNEEAKEIFQYYAITSGGAEYLKDVTDELVFYSNVLDTYFWGITHCGTSWDGVDVELHER
jgi:hypothetical protein